MHRKKESESEFIACNFPTPPLIFQRLANFSLIFPPSNHHFRNFVSPFSDENNKKRMSTYYYFKKNLHVYTIL